MLFSRHARKHFSQAEGSQLDEVRQAMGMLAFPPDTHVSPYKDLLDPARWRMLIQQFRYDNYRLHQLGNSSVFTLTLQAGLSAIKTPYPSAACSPVRPESGALRPAAFALCHARGHCSRPPQTAWSPSGGFCRDPPETRPASGPRRCWVDARVVAEWLCLLTAGPRHRSFPAPSPGSLWGVSRSEPCRAVACLLG